MTGQFQIAGFQPAAQAQVWQYGEAQDTAQSQTSDGHSALANFTATLTLSGLELQLRVPRLLDDRPRPEPGLGHGRPDDHHAGRRRAEPGHRHDDRAFGLGHRPGGSFVLTYTWSAIRRRPPVSFSASTAPMPRVNTTATFSQAGSYTFQVIVADPSGLTATSDVTVNVEQDLTSIAVSPATATVAAGDSRQFAAQADDQFGDLVPLPGPVFAWSLVSGIGSINSFTGVYTAPGEAGSAVVKASLGSLFGTASVTALRLRPARRSPARPRRAPNPVAGTTTDLSVTAADPAGASSLTYTWSAISPLPAGVVFSVNGTNAASQTTATFSRAGS